MWKTISNYSDYKVNSEGVVRSYKGAEVITMKPYIDKDGYRIYRLTSNEGKRKAYKEHRIVANEFIPNPNNLPQVNHINGIKSDNRVENLEWVTNSKNIKHAWDTGLIKGSPYGIIIYDTIKGKEVAYYNGYDKLSELVGLSKLTLYDMMCENKLLYGAYKIIINRNEDYSNKELFEYKFIHKNINGRYKPYRWDNIVFENTKAFQKYTELSSRKFRLALSEKVLNGKPIVPVSHYEYVNS